MRLFHLSLLTCLAATPLMAEHSREMAAHEHGVSTLEIAVEGGRVALDLLSPGADIVGFEHPASRAEDRDAVAAAIRLLVLPENVVALPEAAECRLTGVTVQLDADEHEDHDGDGHSEFRARYQFDCAHPEALSSLAFPFFETFANAQDIEARYVAETGAGMADIARDAAALTLE